MSDSIIYTLRTIDYVKYVPAVLAFAFTWIVFLVARASIYKTLRKYEQSAVVAVVRNELKQLNWAIALITAVYIASKFWPDLNGPVAGAIALVFVAAWLWQAINLIISIINFMIERFAKNAGESGNVALYRFLGNALKLGALFAVVLLFLSNLGFDVSSLVAGLGIGGIAVALAVQNILGDVFNSFSLVADKPFKPGDLITVGNNTGTVLRIGIKSTRIQSIDGEELIIANSDLVKTPVRNLTRQQKHRALIRFSVSAQTDSKLAQDVPVFIREILKNNSEIEPNTARAHMVDLTATGPVFEVEFFAQIKDNTHFLEVKQEILGKILDKLASEDIKLA